MDPDFQYPVSPEPALSDPGDNEVMLLKKLFILTLWRIFLFVTQLMMILVIVIMVILIPAALTVTIMFTIQRITWQTGQQILTFLMQL